MTTTGSGVRTRTPARTGTGPGTPAGPGDATTAPGRRRLPAPLRAELRRGIAPWLGAAVMVTLVVAMAPKASSWQGSWGETQNLLHSASALLGGPLVAAAGCWQAGRERRRGMTELRSSTVRTPLAQTLLCLAPLLLWALAGYAAAAAAVSLATWPYTSGGSPLVSMAATDATWLGTAAVLGFVTGRLVPWRLTAPVAAALMYVVVGLPSYFSSNAQFLTPVARTEADRYLPVWWQGPVMMLWLGGLGAAALLAYAARRRAVALVPLTAALAAAVLITQTGYGMWQKAPAASRVVCGGSAPEICVNGLDGKLLPEVTKALAGLTSRLEGVEGAPAAYRDRLRHPEAAGDEAALPPLTRGWSVTRDRLAAPDEYAHQAAGLLLLRECSSSAYGKDRDGAERVALTDEAVQNWLAPADGPPGHALGLPSDGPARLDAMGDEERREWLGRYLATRKSCTPAEVPVL
ncbi:hypothetical protein [Streptomyces altiplanensis]